MPRNKILSAEEVANRQYQKNRNYYQKNRETILQKAKEKYKMKKIQRSSNTIIERSSSCESIHTSENERVNELMYQCDLDEKK